MFRRTGYATAGLAVMAAAAGCGGGDGSASGPDVVASFYPYEYVAQRVVGGNGEVQNLTAPGVEPHDVELSPQQVADITEADLLVYESGFQPSVDQAVEQNPPAHALDVTEVVPLENTGASSDDAVGGSLEADPHLWLDPTLLMPVAQAVADRMGEIDPRHAEGYRSNARSLVSDLERLDHDFRSGLADCERSAFVTSHAAFGYLARRYHLTMIPIAGLTPESEPSPEHLARLYDLVEEQGITTVFSEALGSKEYADTLAGDLGLTAAVLDPIEGLPDGSDADYLSLMRANLAALQKANGCT